VWEKVPSAVVEWRAMPTARHHYVPGELHVPRLPPPVQTAPVVDGQFDDVDED